MSKKAVRVRKSYVKQWMAVIIGSLSASAMQAAQAAPDSDRTTFREFRDQNPGIDRQTLRGMFRQEFGVAGGARSAAAPTTFLAVPSLSGNVNATQAVQSTVDNARADKWAQRLERHNGVVNQSLQNNAAGNLVSLKNGVNLDLSSAERNITLGQKLFGNIGSVQINVGGETKTISAGQQVTASEYVAVKQVLTGGEQKLTLNSSGASIGGQVDLGSITASNDVMKASDLVVPVGVTTYGDFGRGSDFKLQGDLTNYGSVYAVSSSKSVRGGTIYADDITNQAGGLISTVLDNSLRNNLGGKGRTVDLGLNAKGDLSNYGSITSSGSLTLTAGGNLTNTSEVSAVRDVNLSASSITNSGRVESSNGDVTVDGPATADLNVNNLGGTIAALNGAINVRDAAFAETFNTTVTGGDLLSRQLNLNSGGGVSRVDVNELTGTINQTGSEAHVQAATADLNIGQVCLTGDPTFKNSAGNINIAGNITVAEDLAIIASGNITSANNVTISATSAGTGYNISLIAGAEQLPGGTNSTSIPVGTPTATTLTGNASTGGGSVLLGTGVTISSAGGTAAADAGDILIAAFAGLNFNSGRVNLGGTQINASSGTGNAGDVSILAGAANTTAITLGSINALGAAGSNTVSISTLQPRSSNNANIDFNASGQITSGNSLSGNGSVPTLGGNIQINSGVINSSGALAIASTGNINQSGGSTITGGATIILAEGNITNSVSSTIGSATFLVLQSLNGNIGSSASGRLNISATDIGATASNGSVFINATGSANVDGSATGIFDLQANGAVTTDNPISADIVNLRSLTSNVVLSQDITATTSATIRAQTGISFVSPAVVLAPQVNYRSETGNIDANVATTSVTINALNGNANVASSGNLTFGGGNSFASGALTATAVSNLSTISNVSGNQLSLSAGNSLSIASNLTASDSVSLDSGSDILNSSITGTITTPNLSLLSSNNIGTSSSPLLLDANHITLQANNVYFRDPNTVTLGSSAALFDFNATANNNLLSDNTILGRDVVLESVNGSLSLSGQVDGSDSISLKSFNSINASSISGGLTNGGLAVDNLTLISTNGGVGSSVAPLNVNAEAINVTASGNVGISNSFTGDQLIGGTAGGAFTYTATSGNIRFVNSLTAGGNVLITTNVGNVDIDFSKTVKSTNGNISFSIAGDFFTAGQVNAFGNLSINAVSDIGINTGVTASGDILYTTGGSLILNASSSAGGSVIGTAAVFVLQNDPVTATTGDVVLTANDLFVVNDTVSAGRDIRLTSLNDELLSNSYPNISISAGRDVYLSAKLDVTTALPVSGRNVSLTSTTGDVFVQQQVTATQAISIVQANDITNANINSNPTILNAPQVNLTSTAGSIGTDVSMLTIDVTKLTANAFGSAHIFDPNSVTLVGANSAGNAMADEFEVLGFQGLTLDGTINADTVTLAAASGGIYIGGDITSRDASINSGSSDLTMDSSALISATDQLVLTGQNVGEANSRMHISTPLVVLNINGATGSGYIDAVGSLRVSTINAGTGALADIKAENDLRIGGSVGTIVGEATGGSIILDTVTATTANLTAFNSFDSATNLAAQPFVNLSLTSTNGNIGVAGTPVVLSASVVNLTVNAPNGEVNISGNSTNLALVGDSSASADMFIGNTGDITVPGTVSGQPVVLFSIVGTISVTGTVSSTDSITISAVSIDAADIPLGSLSAPKLILAADNNIGSSAAPIQTLTDELQFVANGGDVYVENGSALNLISGTATGTASISAVGNLSSSGSVTAADLVLDSTTGGFDLDGAVIGTNSITLNSFNSILNSNISGGLSGSMGGPVPSLTLLSSNGDIGAVASPLSIDALNLTANAPSGSVYITDTSAALNVAGASGALNTFKLTAAGALTSGAAGTVSAKDVSLTSTNAGITLGALVSGSSSIEVVANFSIDNTTVGGGLSSPVIELTSTTGSININTVDFVSVTANAAASVTLVDTTGSMNIGPGASTAGTTFSATAASLTNDGTINAANVELTATTGGFTFNNVITGTTIIVLSSNDDILNGVGAGQLVTPTLSATSTNGDIGTALDPLTLSVSSVTLNAPTGSVWVDNAIDVAVIGASGASGTFSLHADGNIAVNAAISASIVDLTSKDGSGGIVTLTSPIAGATSVTVASDAGIAAANLGSTITTPVLNLITTSGSIGTLVTPVTIAGGTGTVSIHSAGSAYVSKSTGSLIVTESSAVGDLFITANVNLTTNGELVANNVSLTATTGSLQINDDIIGVNSISLTSANSILSGNIVGELMSTLFGPVNQLNLTVTAGNIGDLNDLLTVNVNNARLVASGSVFLLDLQDGINFTGGASSAGNSNADIFQVIADYGNITSTSSISGGVVLLSAVNKFDLDGSVNGAFAIALTAGTGIQNADISGGLNSPSLTLFSSTGDIGTQLNPLSIDTDNLRANVNAGSVYIADANSVTVTSSSSATGTFSVSAANTLALSDNGVNLLAPSVILDAGTSLSLGRTIAASTSVALLSGGTLTQSAGSINTVALTVAFVTGPVTLTTDASTLETLDGAGQTLTINEANGIQLLGQAVGNLNVNAALLAAGNVTTGADFSVANLNIVNSNGNIVLSNNVGATATMVLNTQGGSGYIQHTTGLLTTPSLTALAGVGGIGLAGNDLKFTNGANPVSLTANATGGGDISVVYAGTGTVNVQASSGNNFYTIDTTNGGSINLAGNVSGAATLNLITDNLSSSATANFDQIKVSNSPTGALSITGGTYTTANGFTVLSSHGINLSGTILLNGTGEAAFTVGDEPDQFVVNAGAVVTGANRTTVNACDLVFNGIITGNPLVIVCSNNGTIANSLGDVLLPSDLVFVGQNLAILAAGNITATGSTLIDLSSASGSGSLTLMAGYDFTPATGGQIQGPGAYTITGVSSDGGSINLGNVSIVLNGGTGAGGNLTAVANNGLVNSGSITLGTVDTTGATAGGVVRVTGEGGISVGNIDTTGGTASGNVSLAVATPTIVGGPITVQNGVLTSGSFGVGAQTSGNLLFHDITATGADVTITGARLATDSISHAVGGTLVANRLNLVVGDGSVLVDQTTIDELNVTGGSATVFLLGESDGLNLNNIVGADLMLDVTSLAAPITTGTSAINIRDLTLRTNAGSIILNGDISGSTSVYLSSAMQIIQNAGTIGGGNLDVSFGLGPATLNTNIASLSTSGAGVLTINEANDIALGFQSIGDLTLNVANGNVTTTSDFNLVNLAINVANGTVAVTNSIGSSGITNVFADDGVTTTGTGVINGGTVVLDTNATLGVDAANRLQVNAATFQVEGTNVFVNNQNIGASTLNASSAVNTLDVSTAGDLVSGGNYSAAVVALATGGAFNLTSTITGTTSVSLTTDGDLTNITGTLNTPTLLLNSVNGNVGTDANNPFLVAANVATIGGTAGDGFFVSSASTAGVNFAAITAGGDINLKANGGLNLTQNITSTGGAFAVTATQDTLNIADGITILAHDQIDITMLGSTKKRDSIVFGNGSSVITNAKTPGLGNVNIVLGTPQSPGRKTPTPKKYVTVVENGGSVLFGGKKAQAVSGGIVFTAQGADVYVSTFNPKSIVFEGNNIITADPPVAPGTPVLVTQFTGGGGTTQPAELAASTTISGDLGSNSVSNALNLNGSDTLNSLKVSAFGSSNFQNIQNVSMSNATLNSTAFANLSTSAQTTALGVGEDDSFMTSRAPQGEVLNASLCSDVEFAGAAGFGSVETLEHSACVSLANGSVLFAPTTDTTVVTPKGKIKVAANAVAMVVVDDQHLSVYDVNDLHKNSVVIEAAGRSIPLSPGKHAIVTNANIDQFSEINPVESIMHRGMSRHELGNGRRAFTSEFSVPAAIQSIKPLSAMILSNHSHAKKVKERVMKTTAIIMQLSGNAPYESHAKPRTVALKW